MLKSLTSLFSIELSVLTIFLEGHANLLMIDHSHALYTPLTESFDRARPLSINQCLTRNWIQPVTPVMVWFVSYREQWVLKS